MRKRVDALLFISVTVLGLLVCWMLGSFLVNIIEEAKTCEQRGGEIVSTGEYSVSYIPTANGTSTIQTTERMECVYP